MDHVYDIQLPFSSRDPRLINHNVIAFLGCFVHGFTKFQLIPTPLSPHSLSLTLHLREVSIDIPHSIHKLHTVQWETLVAGMQIFMFFMD